MAQLQGANLSWAQLQGAHLRMAQLQEANLMAAQLEGAILNKAQLQDANLREAQLQGAFLIKAQLRGAYLNGAILEGQAIKEDGEPGWDLPAADVTDTDFHDADLSNAQLSTVTGLRAERLAGAVLTNAKLPKDVASFDQLKHVEETSRNATTVFFGLLAASLYSWLTIATTTDVALITGSASSPLPIINTNIALSGFYLAAPLILIAVYCYFHLYLQRLWRGLASLPAVFPDGEALDDKAYPWLLNGLVRAHFKKLELAQRPLTRGENFISVFLAWWVVPITLLAFWLRLLPRHDWLGTMLHAFLIGGAAWFGVSSYQLAVRTLRGATAPDEENKGDQPLLVRMWRTIRRYRPGGMEAAGFGVGIVVMLSVSAAIEPGDDFLTAFGSGLGYETYADLTDDDVSTKPSGWTGRDETAAVEIAQVKGADLEGSDLRNADAVGAFLVKANISRADLSDAVLRQADLTDANLSDADVFFANLTGAKLTRANLTGVDAILADLTGANLTRANLTGVNLTGVNLTGANLTGANLTGADLTDANLSDADLADLTGADLTGADLADLTGAFGGFPGANLTGANLTGAHGVTQEQLDAACGDDMTKLPEGLTITPCRTPGQEGASTSRQEGTKQQGVDVEEILLDLQIGFASNDTSLNTSATEKLDGTLEYLKNEPGLKDAILIEGYADATGSSRYNQQLSLRRAEIVRDYLIDHGVDRSWISVFGFGESCPWLPFSPEHDENRRVRIVSCAGSGAEIDRCRTVSVRPAMPGPDQRQ
jgi:uncharacterized protein YjbI with pentapeptide repeats